MDRPPPRPRIRVLYDGDCGFCTSSVIWAERVVRPDVVFVPWQWEPASLTEPLRPVLTQSVVAVRDDVVVATAGRAVILVFRSSPRRVFGWLAWVMDLRPLRPLVEAGYRFVARHRGRLPGGTPACRMGPPPSPS